jgi:hypothetical protein
MKENFFQDLLFVHKIALSCDYFWPAYNERYDVQNEVSAVAALQTD